MEAYLQETVTPRNAIEQCIEQENGSADQEVWGGRFLRVSR